MCTPLEIFFYVLAGFLAGGLIGMIGTSMFALSGRISRTEEMPVCYEHYCSKRRPE